MNRLVTRLTRLPIFISKPSIDNAELKMIQKYADGTCRNLDVECGKIIHNIDKEYRKMELRAIAFGIVTITTLCALAVDLVNDERTIL